MVKQLYFPDTNVLITRFLTPDGVAEVEDFMPIHREPHHRRHLIRRVVGVRGEMRLRMECEPRFDYGRAAHEVEIADHGALFRSPALTLALSTEAPLERRGAGVVGEFTLSAGQSATFALEQADDGALPPPLQQARGDGAVRADGALLARLARATRATRAAGARWCTARR